MKFEKGDKIEIFGDYFIVGKVSKAEIELLTKDRDIFDSKIILEKTQMVLFTERLVDTKMEKKGFRLNEKNYQIINQEKKEEFDGNKWIRFTRSEVQPIGKKDKYNRVIIEYNEKKKIFYNWERLIDENIEFNPTEEFETKKNTNNKKIKIKINDLP